ncbi:MAG: hypothetical protein K5663_07595 [Clostridiales bacterium]|nr:hypothetical protein [Clostridiales bacterium]
MTASEFGKTKPGFTAAYHAKKFEFHMVYAGFFCVEDLRKLTGYILAMTR